MITSRDVDAALADDVRTERRQKTHGNVLHPPRTPAKEQFNHAVRGAAASTIH